MTEDIKKELVRRCMVKNEPIWLVIESLLGRGFSVDKKRVYRFFDKVLSSDTLKYRYFRGTARLRNNPSPKETPTCMNIMRQTIHK